MALATAGGVPPYSWQILTGQLPPGCKLHAKTGMIAGVPTAAGDYHFTVAVTDSTVPQMRTQRELTIRVIEGLTLEWKEPPQVRGNSIEGSALVENHTASELNLTVIIVAINQIGRATTLGYEHLKLAPEHTTQVIPFGSAPGAGTYYVRADAAAHPAANRHIYRAGKQTAPMNVPGLSTP